jgi:pimeloyl-ACP methyl ester carboxylesterase
MRILYLHGFASSPASRKARWFLEKLGEQGIRAEALDLAPDFRHLTISGQLGVLERALGGERVVLIGSSLGGYLAALYAARSPEVERLILLAPAFDFYQLWAAELGPEKMREWRENGSISVFHYGIGRQALLDYQMMEDARQYEAFPDFRQPCLILHGLKDTVVPFGKSAEFADSHANVTLIPLHSGHELTDMLSEIWQASSTFLLSASTKVE